MGSAPTIIGLVEGARRSALYRFRNEAIGKFGIVSALNINDLPRKSAEICGVGTQQ